MEIADLHIRVADASGVGEARRLTHELAKEVGLSQAKLGALSLLVTESASNLIKHGGGGDFLVSAIHQGAKRGIAIVALDHGAGIANVAEALRDGFSSAGSPGTGLGAMVRLASSFDIYSRRGVGTVVLAMIVEGPEGAKAAFAVGGINIAYPGESVSGDRWEVIEQDDRLLALVVDGLGHGDRAHEAAGAAAKAFRDHAAASPQGILERIHEALRSTRGAAVAVTEIDRLRHTVSFAGLGNIAGTILDGDSTRSLVSHYGTAGHEARRFQAFSYPWPAHALLILHSDGIASHWKFDSYPGLREKIPMLAAALLYRDFRRGRDDASVVVIRESR